MVWKIIFCKISCVVRRSSNWKKEYTVNQLYLGFTRYVYSGCRFPGIWIMSKQNIWRLVHSKKNLGWRLYCKPHFLPDENFLDRNNNDEQIRLHYDFWLFIVHVVPAPKEEYIVLPLCVCVCLYQISVKFFSAIITR